MFKILVMNEEEQNEKAVQLFLRISSAVTHDGMIDTGLEYCSLSNFPSGLYNCPAQEDSRSSALSLTSCSSKEKQHL